MSATEEELMVPYIGLRRCSSAICLSEGKSLLAPLEHPDLTRVRQLEKKPCLKSNDKRTEERKKMRLVSDRNSDITDDVFETSSMISFRSDEYLPSYTSQPKDVIGSIVLILSGLYGILLVVIGCVVPVTETFVHPVRPYPFEVFYIYLYSVSIAFIVYIYLFLLHDSPFAVQLGNLKRTISERGSFKRKIWSNSHDTENCNFDECSQGSCMRKKKVTFKNGKSKSSAGSFYLRLGAVAFGIGCMILEGLYLGQILETSHTSSPCKDFVMLLRPLLKPCFTFFQLFFIFRNSKIIIYKNRYIAKFGFMHMAATNICVWFRIIVMETLQTLYETTEKHKEKGNKTGQHEPKVSDVVYVHVNSNISHYNEHVPHDNIEDHSESGPFLTELSCRYSNMIGGMLMEMSHFLYPFCIEYSVICAGILYVMWENVGTKNRIMFEDLERKDSKQSHRMSVDCSGSSRGLFLGILLFVSMVCSLIVSYVFSEHHPDLKSTAVIVHATEMLILVLGIGANIAAAVRMRNLRFTMETNDLLEETLILISMTGLYMFSIFNLMAAFFYVNTLKGILTIIVYFLVIILATTQTIFLIYGLRLSAKLIEHKRDKPGREFVSFLMLCNFSLWVITTFEMQKPAHNPQQMEMYGVLAWTIFTHISAPLGIFYFFHSTVCLSHIWKHAWKFNRNRSI